MNMIWIWHGNGLNMYTNLENSAFEDSTVVC